MTKTTVESGFCDLLYAAALARITKERFRQQSEEGWTAEHDDFNVVHGALVSAGVCYLQHALGTGRYTSFGAPSSWPWAVRWWKPTTPLRDLEKAGALFLAERDRLIRAGLPPSQLLLDLIFTVLEEITEKLKEQETVGV